MDVEYSCRMYLYVLPGGCVVLLETVPLPMELIAFTILFLAWVLSRLPVSGVNQFYLYGLYLDC